MNPLPTDERQSLAARIERHIADCAAYEGHVFDLYPDEQQMVVDALRAPSPTVEEMLDIQPNIGSETPEPSLRQILLGYYNMAQVSPEWAREHCDKYIAALSSASAPAGADGLTYDERIEMLRLADDIEGAEIGDLDQSQSQIVTRALRLAAAPSPSHGATDKRDGSGL